MKAYLLSFAFVGLCIAIALAAYKLGAQKKYTRKIVHILVGFEWVILYLFAPANIHTVLICLVFTLLLLISYIKKMLPMMSSDGENDPGTVYYGISMTLMSVVCYFLPNYMFAFGIAVFCTSLGDGFAGVAGYLAGKYNKVVFRNKTVVGTVCCFTVSLLSVFAFSQIFALRISVANSIAIALFVAGMELISAWGTDNLSIPLLSGILSHAVIFYPEIISDCMIPIVLTPFVIAFVLAKGILTRKGVLFALLLDLCVSVSLGNFGFVYLLAFLLLSVAIDKVKNKRKGNQELSKEKHDCRNSLQVVANGVVPACSAVLYLIFKNEVFLVAYIAGLAEAFADTCASGVGSSSTKVYNIIGFRKIDAGLSGGVSLTGTLASLFAAFAFPMMAVFFGKINWFLFVLIAICAFLGNIFDSILGSLLQVKFKCVKCGKTTEEKMHCGTETVRFKGIKIIDNNAVNLLSTLFTSIAAGCLYVFIF